MPIKCPKCGHEQRELLSRLKDSPTLICGGCGISIEIKGEQIKALLNALGGQG